MDMRKKLENMKKKDPRMIILEKRNKLGIATGEVIGVQFISMPNGITKMQFIGDPDISDNDMLEVIEMMKSTIKNVHGECKVVREGWNSDYQNYLK